MFQWLNVWYANHEFQVSKYPHMNSIFCNHGMHETAKSELMVAPLFYIRMGWVCWIVVHDDWQPLLWTQMLIFTSTSSSLSFVEDTSSILLLLHWRHCLRRTNWNVVAYHFFWSVVACWTNLHVLLNGMNYLSLLNTLECPCWWLLRIEDCFGVFLGTSSLWSSTPDMVLDMHEEYEGLAFGVE